MSDDDLVIRARRDRAAFAALYDRYYPRVWRYCLRRLFVRECAEDATSETFLQVARHLPGFAGSTETDFRRWLFRIASNVANAELRKTQRRQELRDRAARSGALHATGGSASSMLDMLDWPALHQAIQKLDPRDEAILSLRFFADLSHDEIAGIVGMNAGAVRTALSRTLHKLRERFRGTSHEREPRA